MSILCRYLRGYWRALLELPPSQRAYDALGNSTFGTYPLDAGDGPFGRWIFDHWVGDSDGPAPDLPSPSGTMRFLDSRDYDWSRVHENFYIIREPDVALRLSLFRGDEALAGSRPARDLQDRWEFGATDVEADTIGLALRFLQASFRPMGGSPSAFRHWESLYREGESETPFGFSVAAHDVVSETEAWHRGDLDHALCNVLRTGLDGAGFAATAGGRGNAADRIVSLNRDNSDFRRANDAVVALREAAVAYLAISENLHPDCDSRPPPDDDRLGLSQDLFWKAASRLAQLAELILHEGTHVLCWSRWEESSGIAGEWFDGPAHGEPFVSFPSIQSYDFGSGGSAFSAVALGVQPPWFLSRLPGPPLRVHPHYAVTLFAAWWECLIRHNRAPLMSVQRHSCSCLGTSSPSLPEHPAHWGWLDGTCMVEWLNVGTQPLGWSQSSSWPASTWGMDNFDCAAPLAPP
jgi:hypothetical protein